MNINFFIYFIAMHNSCNCSNQFVVITNKFTNGEHEEREMETLMEATVTNRIET